MPPEWAPHAGCWMAWPCRPENWDDIEKARATYVEVARAIARFEPVTMTANAEDAGAARGALAGVAGAEVVVVPSDDSWARDTAPTFVIDGRGGLGGVDWRFNAYGGIYEEYGRTRNMARRILDLLGARRFAAPLVLEGGAVHVDGEGTVLTTAEVVLDPRRNPGLERDEAERLLCEYLGAEKVLWLSSALDHDNTGGHVDNLACFVAPGVVVAARLRRPGRPAVRRRAREPGAAARGDRCPRPRARGGRAAHAGAPGVPRAPALAQLRQLLRRERRRRDAGLRRSRPTTRRATCWRASSPAGPSSRSRRSSSPRPTATSTASRSSSRSPEDPGRRERFAPSRSLQRYLIRSQEGSLASP